MSVTGFTRSLNAAESEQLLCPTCVQIGTVTVQLEMGQRYLASSAVDEHQSS